MPDPTDFSGPEATQLDDQPLIIRRLRASRGQNSQDEPDSIGLDEVASLQNADISSRGISATRPGTTLIANTPAATAVLGLQHFYPEGGTKQLLMVAGATLYNWTASGNWNSLYASLTTGLRTNILIGGKKALLLNGTDDPPYYDGATVTAGGSANTDPPKAKFGIYHQNRALLAGNTTNRSYIWYSAALNILSFVRDTNAIKISDQDNDELTALVDLSLTTTPGFIAFKTRSTHFVDSSDASPANWSVIPIDPVHGCFATRTAIAIGGSVLGGDVVYLSREGTHYRLRSLRRTVNDALETGGILSEGIEDILDDVADSHMANAAAYYFDEKIFLSIPSGSSSTQDTVCVLDLHASDPASNKWKWTVWKGITADVFAIFQESNVEYLYYGNAGANARVFRMLSGTSDNNSAIEFIEESRREDFGLPELLKNGEFVEFHFNSTDDTEVTLEASIDGGEYTTIGTVNVGGSGPTLPVNLPFNLSGQSRIKEKVPIDDLGPFRDIQFRVSHSDLDTGIEYLGYIAAAFPIPLELSND